MYLRSALVLAAAVAVSTCSTPDPPRHHQEEPEARPSARGQQPGTIVGTAGVIDGDTIEVDGQRIRLFGIDAPETDQTCGRAPCGKQATDAMRSLVGGRAVTCDQRDTDRYDRVVAVCHAGGQDINAWMVTNGWAVSYVKYGADYAALEGEARQSEVGIWRYGASVENPWDYRKRKRVAGNAAPGDCKIKGNVSAKGKRIYHSPGQQFYDETRISTRKGERWFCTTAEAREAGWRAARR